MISKIVLENARLCCADQKLTSLENARLCCAGLRPLLPLSDGSQVVSTFAKGGAVVHVH